MEKTFQAEKTIYRILLDITCSLKKIEGRKKKVNFERKRGGCVVEHAVESQLK